VLVVSHIAGVNTHKKLVVKMDAQVENGL